MIFIECPRCHNLIQISNYSKDEMIECQHCYNTFYPSKHNSDKPPLGTKPCHIHAEQRIKDLGNAILRNIGSNEPEYDTIRRWATEIVLQCDLAEIVDGDFIKFREVREELERSGNINNRIAITKGHTSDK